MGRPMEGGAWGVFRGDTAIKYAPYAGGAVELELGGDNRFNLLVTDKGLARLAAVIDAAIKDEQRLSLLNGEPSTDGTQDFGRAS